MKNYLITLIDKEGNQKKIGCQSENINTAVAYATSQMQMPFTVVSVEELGVAPDDRLTSLERLILDNLPKGFKYITRDECGELFVYTKKPSKFQEYWMTSYKNTGSMCLFNHLFKNIKWEDDEPYKFR